MRKDISGDSIANEVNRYMNERSAAQTDSTLTAGTNDSIATRQASAVSDDELEMRFIPVARITHTADLTTNRHEFLSYEPANNYYAHNYLPYDSIDRTDYWTLKNTVALSLREGFNKWAIADITAYVSYVYSNYRQPDTIGTREYRLRTDEHTLMIGGQIESTRNRYLKYKLRGETAVSGNDLGAFNIEGKGELNLRLLKQESKLTLNAHIKNNRPSYYYRHYHSEHYWWDKNLDKEFRTRIEAGIALPRWKTSIKAGIENIKNYTYFANTPVANGNRYLSDITVKQESSNIQVLSATLKQDFGAGPLNLETEFTYQNSSNKSILPLPELNAYANLYIKFRIAKVLNTELGADCRYFTSYYAPDYSAALGQFVQQNQSDKISIGNYPIVSVYANFLLKETRFYVMYYHVNEGTGNRNYFLAPHYPMSPKALWFGLSWNFYN